VNQEPSTHDAESGHPVRYWPRASILEAWELNSSLKEVANRCRLNAISAIQVAGSGHIGTSLSSLDIMVAVRRFLGGKTFLSSSTDRIFFSSKGHDAPAFYAVMHACGQLEDSDLFTLRRLGGLPGHPETITPGVATNTGSLGMGISKAKGFVKAQRLAQQDSRLPVVVMLGDGELNEGQIWESLPGAARDGFSELVAIVDANAIQSDTWTGSTLPMGDVRKRVEGSGWRFLECQGNDPDEVLRVLEESVTSTLPTFVWAHTVKGSGISWMERFPENGEYYKFHSGAMDPELYAEASSILIGSVAGGREGRAESALPRNRPEFDALTPRARGESMLTLWEKMLCDVMADNERVVALDGDLSFDTGTHLARHLFPERYIQSGIAEQDMVSMAGTLALSGHIPIVHSFSTFLTMRATEQIFNNATEYSQIIYMGFLSGLVPSAPGFSHQAVTDVGIMSSIPGMRVFEPACETELRWVVDQALSYQGPSFIRMGGLAPLSPAESEGFWVERFAGSEVALVSSGPLLAREAMEARDVLHDEHGVRAALFTVAEITGDSLENLAKELEGYSTVVVLENHNPALAKYEILENWLGSKPAVRVSRLGLHGVPANGQPQEVLRYHGFDAVSIAGSVVDAVGQ
jgi:transketolase